VKSVDLAPELGGGGSEDEDAGGGATGGGDSTRVLPGEQEFVAIVRVVYTVAPAT